MIWTDKMELNYSSMGEKKVNIINALESLASKNTQYSVILECIFEMVKEQVENSKYDQKKIDNITFSYPNCLEQWYNQFGEEIDNLVGLFEDDCLLSQKKQIFLAMLCAHCLTLNTHPNEAPKSELSQYEYLILAFGICALKEVKKTSLQLTHFLNNIMNALKGKFDNYSYLEHVLDIVNKMSTEVKEFILNQSNQNALTIEYLWSKGILTYIIYLYYMNSTGQCICHDTETAQPLQKLFELNTNYCGAPMHSEFFEAIYQGVKTMKIEPDIFNKLFPGSRQKTIFSTLALLIKGSLNQVDKTLSIPKSKQNLKF